MTKRPSLEDLQRAGFVLPEGAKVVAVQMSWAGTGAEPVPAPNKYHSRRAEYAGLAYDSRAEARRAKALDEDRAAGAVSWWIRHPKFHLGCPENVYIADALVVTPGGVRVEDTKGHRTKKFLHDVKLWRSYGPCELWVITGGKVVEVIPGGGAGGHV